MGYRQPAVSEKAMLVTEDYSAGDKRILLTLQGLVKKRSQSLIIWCYGHCGIVRNEEASKTAVEGREPLKQNIALIHDAAATSIHRHFEKSVFQHEQLKVVDIADG